MIYETSFLIVAFLTLSAYLLCRRFLDGKPWVNRKVFFIIGLCFGIASLGIWWVVLSLQGKKEILFYSEMFRASAKAVIIATAIYFFSLYLKGKKSKQYFTIGCWLILAVLSLYFSYAFASMYRDMSVSRSCGEVPTSPRGYYILFGLDPDTCRKSYGKGY